MTSILLNHLTKIKKWFKISIYGMSVHEYLNKYSYELFVKYLNTGYVFSPEPILNKIVIYKYELIYHEKYPLKTVYLPFKYKGIAVVYRENIKKAKNKRDGI